MLKILIVEDDRQLATTLKYLVEDNPRYRVVATADDLDSAVAAADDHHPELALVDLHLARGTTGFSVAVRMQDYDIPCFFISGKAPDFPMPDLALGLPDEALHRRRRPPQPRRGRGHDARARSAAPQDAGQPHPLRPARPTTTAASPASSPRSARSRPGSNIGSPARSIDVGSAVPARGPTRPPI